MTAPDEDYENTGQQPEQYVPLQLIRSPTSKEARRPSWAVYANAPQSPGGAAARDPMSWDPTDPARAVLDRLLAESDVDAMLNHNDDPQAPRLIDQFAPPRQFARQRQTPTEERQWGRLNNIEKRAIRRVLQQIPCRVTHDSELGMMRLINRFRSRRSGGAKRQQNKRSKTHKRRKH